MQPDPSLSSCIGKGNPSFRTSGVCTTRVWGLVRSFVLRHTINGTYLEAFVQGQFMFQYDSSVGTHVLVNCRCFSSPLSRWMEVFVLLSTVYAIQMVTVNAAFLLGRWRLFLVLMNELAMRPLTTVFINQWI